MTEKITLDKIRDTFKGRISAGESWSHHFAVLLPIIDAADGLKILYEVRAADLDRQPGEVCFPGGQIEECETPQEAALRETEEELGICASDVEVIDRLVTIGTRAGGQIHCFIGVISEETYDTMNISSDEVAEVFAVPVDDLVSARCDVYWNPVKETPVDNFPYDRVTSGEAYKWKDGRAPVPVFDVNGRIIWGLTGRMTKEFLEVLTRGSI